MKTTRFQEKLKFHSPPPPPKKAHTEQTVQVEAIKPNNCAWKCESGGKDKDRQQNYKRHTEKVREEATRSEA